MNADAVRQLFRNAGQPCPLDTAPPPLPAGPSPWERKQEKEMHTVFQEWLNLHRLNFCHGRMNKATDLPPGHPDFVIYTPGASVLFVEFKTLEGRVSEVQKEYISQLNQLGFKVLVAKSADEAIRFVKSNVSIP